MEPVSVKGDCRLVQTVNGKPEVRFNGQFTSNVEVVLPEWKNLPSGAYELQLTARMIKVGMLTTNKISCSFPMMIIVLLWHHLSGSIRVIRSLMPDVLHSSVWELPLKILM